MKNKCQPFHVIENNAKKKKTQNRSVFLLEMQKEFWKIVCHSKAKNSQKCLYDYLIQPCQLSRWKSQGRVGKMALVTERHMIQQALKSD